MSRSDTPMQPHCHQGHPQAGAISVSENDHSPGVWTYPARQRNGISLTCRIEDVAFRISMYDAEYLFTLSRRLRRWRYGSTDQHTLINFTHRRVL